MKQKRATIMSETLKKTKISTESVISDIATSIESLVDSLELLNKSHAHLLKVNKAVVALKLQIDQENKENLNKTILIPEGN